MIVRGLQVALSVALLGLWQLAAARQWPDPALAKSPVQSWDYLVNAARSGVLWSNTYATMTAVLIAWVLAGLAGVVAGVALGLMPRTERVLNPYLDAANAMPRIAFAPLLSSVLGARKHQVFRKVLLPVATPAIFAALRLGLIYSLLGVVGSELISARDGLGQLIAYDSSVFQMDGAYGILLLLAVIAVVLNQLMGFLERRLLRWQPPAVR